MIIILGLLSCQDAVWAGRGLSPVAPGSGMGPPGDTMM